jgi:bromodomain-containing protein 7/9
LEAEEPERSLASLNADLRKGGVNGHADYELGPPEEVNEVLNCVADIIVELDQKTRAKSVQGHGVNGSPCAAHEATKEEEPDEVQKTIEDPPLRNLRLNLLALAKRAPLDTIAHLPKDLVPAHIRRFVPTLSSN